MWSRPPLGSCIGGREGAVSFRISIAAIECPRQFADWCCLGAGPGLACVCSWSCRALIVFVYSFFERGTYGGIDYVFTLENYARAVDPLYLLDPADLGAHRGA